MIWNDDRHRIWDSRILVILCISSMIREADTTYSVTNNNFSMRPVREVRRGCVGLEVRVRYLWV